ncbi:Glutathione S-transferase protein [Aphelenchoides besseyi]|nr:Glutathione S-transferase protein [Aphelenchoides besseyi]
MSKPSYRITYFQARGLAEMSRMVLAYANDERLDAQTMDSRREEFPYGRLPVLVIDGKTTLAESCAIARYLAKKFGLAGKDDIEACIVDGVADVQKDIGAACSSFFAVASGRQQGDKEQLKQSVLIPTLSKFLPLLQKQLEASGSGFYATSGPTWVAETHRLHHPWPIGSARWHLQRWMRTHRSSSSAEEKFPPMSGSLARTPQLQSVQLTNPPMQTDFPVYQTAERIKTPSIIVDRPTYYTPSSR